MASSRSAGRLGPPTTCSGLIAARAASRRQHRPRLTRHKLPNTVRCAAPARFACISRRMSAWTLACIRNSKIDRMKRLLPFAVGVVLLCLLAAAQDAALSPVQRGREPALRSLQGTVKTKDDEPLEKAIVYLK